MSFRNFTQHAAEVRTSVPQMKKISSNMTCTSDMSLKDDDLVECIVSDASLSDDNMPNETVEDRDPDETEGKDPDSASTEKTLSCQETLKNGGFLETEQVFKLSTTSKCLPAIPMATKEKAFYVLKNERNQMSREQMERKVNFQMTVEHGLVLEDQVLKQL